MNNAQQVEGFDQWLDKVSQVCGRFSANRLGPQFEGSIDEYRSGELKMSFVEVAQTQLFRTRHDIEQSAGSHYYAAFQLAGEAVMEQQGRCITLLPGDITLIDSTCPSNFVYRNNARQLSLILPREKVEQQSRYAPVEPAQRIPAAASMAGLAKHLILGATQQRLSLAESEATLDALISLLRPAMGASEVDDSLQERTFRKALRVIDQHIADEALCPQWLATQIGVSVRGLYRVFSRHGLVVAQYVKNRRLDRCAEQLRQMTGEGKLCALAYAWGFNDSSHFSTAFKARFGVSPGEYCKRYVN
ncbi:transcriptional regulator FeaR [Pseudomonas vancouverensis]|uniref:Transcriptional regulator FeaR n=1 Tax=Pseudomonas vancouverensis TaxID=95300 RepID=A0A1H2NBT4_PSEVA|nr:transcriptional regulator FeaR [Pseudomonas vancouverensis]KAB0494087.1 transcriptional regulator FeaR [Pseudomonas vancouverensis]TDB61524.1 transcriptional regulator FeaR [Pseudomonas vancouverensis]SDV02306.1 transcriptional regulator, AraC family [Pseudomonas vancouverensis]